MAWPGLDFIPFNKKFKEINYNINNGILDIYHYMRIAEKYMESSLEILF